MAPNDRIDDGGPAFPACVAERPCDACWKTFRPVRRTSRFCSRPCMWKKLAESNRKPEGWYLDKRGYVEGYIWENDVRRKVWAHRYVMELVLGRRLLPDEDVHHINGIKGDNRPSNLQVLRHGEHTTLSNTGRIYSRGYSLKLSSEERAARAGRMRQIRKLTRKATASQCQ